MEIIYKTQEINILFEANSPNNMKEFMNFCAHKLYGLESITFDYLFGHEEDIKKAYVRCQYADNYKQKIICHIYKDANKILTPMDCSIFTNTFFLGFMILEIGNEAFSIKYISKKMLDMMGYSKDDINKLSKYDITNFIYTNDLISSMKQYKSQLKKMITLTFHFES